MASVNNHDIVGLYNRINRFLDEIHKSSSSAVSEYNEFDMTRSKSYLEAIDTYHDWVIAQPQLDLPETSPKTYELLAVPSITRVENESINDFVRIFTLTRDSLVNSQSARMPAGLMSYDSVRLRAITSKARNLLQDYVEPITPLDLPESSPQAPSSGAGRTGI